MSYKFERTVNYYETDKMGVVHHSNYIRYMEEARCALLQKLGMPFSEFEKRGVTIPVLGVKCKHKFHATFEDTIVIELVAKEYTGVRLTMGYEMRDKKTGNLLLTGETKHCFTNHELKPINLKKHIPEFSDKFQKFLEGGKEK